MAACEAPFAMERNGAEVEWRYMSRPIKLNKSPNDHPSLEADLALVRAAFDASPVGVVVVDASGAIQLINQQILELLGYSKEELVGQPVEIIIPVDVRDRHVGLRTEFMNSPITRVMGERSDIRAKHKNGEEIPVEVGLKVCHVNETISIVATINNITARKRAEEAARESEKRFHELADSAPVLIWMSNAEGECIYCNAQWLSFTGQPLLDVLGHGWSKNIHPDDRDACLDDCHKAHVQRHRFSIEYRLKRSDGQYRWMVDTGIPRRDSEGKFLGFVGTCVDVTELKATQLEQQRLRSELSSILDHVPSMIWYKDGKNRILRANRTAAASIGRTRQEVEGRQTEELFPEDAAKYLEDDRAVIESEIPKLNIIERYITQGEERWVKTDKVPYRAPNGHVEGIIAIATDVTELKRNEAALRESEERFEHAVSGSSDGLWDWDVKTDEVYYSPRFKALLGYRDDEFANTLDDWTSRLHTDDQDSTMTAARAHLERGDPFDVKHRVRCKNGEFRWFRARGKAIRNDAGAATRMSGSITDITEQHIAEEQVAASNAQLEAVRAALIRFLEDGDIKESMDALLNDLLKLTNSAYGFIGEVLRTEAGEPYLRTNAIRRVSSSESTQQFFANNAPADLEFYDLDNLFGHVIKTKKTVIANDPHNDARGGGLPPGHPPLRRFLGLPIHYRQELIGMVGIANSTEDYDKSTAASLQPFLATCASIIQAHRVETERSRAERELGLARERAETASRAKTAFLANMSHELRTPLNSVIGFTNRLIRTAESDDLDRKIDALETIDRNAKHLLQMITDILDLSKIDAGYTDIQFSTFDVMSAVRDAVDRTASLADDKPVELKLDLPVKKLPITADRTKVQQITMNLLANAINYTEAGTVRVSLAESSMEDGAPAIGLTVSDTGCGIQATDIDKLFEKFTQLDGESTRRVGGTGLGLAITKELVDAHGGTIEVNSTFGEGSEFSVLIPVAPSGHAPLASDLAQASN